MLPLLEDIGDYAVFLDLDGTLVETADHPDAVRVHPTTISLLERLRLRCDRAFAVVSGRDIAVVDRLLHPLATAAAGVHGLQRRGIDGALHTFGSLDVEPIVSALQSAIGSESGVLIERKPNAVALHYRLRPELESRCREIVEELVQQDFALRLLRGKMVFELTMKGMDKGRAIAAFLAEPPFLGRSPLFAGDDVTDEEGFAVVNRCGGVSIKVGKGATQARFRAENVETLLSWLWNLVGIDRKERVG